MRPQLRALSAVQSLMAAAPVLSRPLSNAEIAHRLVAYAQTLQAKGENPYKVRAYRRALSTTELDQIRLTNKPIHAKLGLDLPFSSVG